MKINNSRGITLVEILAAIVITAFISIAIITVLTNGQKVSIKQSDTNIQLMDAALALKVITKEIRTSESDIKLISPIANRENCYSILEIDNIAYSLNNNELKKGESTIANNIKDFEVCKNTNNQNMLEIKIELNNGKTESTVILIR